MLNSTLTATERTLCCVLENYQTPDGVRVPPVLQPFMMGIDFIPFKKMYDAKGKLVDRMNCSSRGHKEGTHLDLSSSVGVRSHGRNLVR